MYIQDKYRLELLWDSVVKEDGAFKFKNARFSGPALNNIAKISGDDNIDLDFTEQYLILIPNFYIAKLSWKKVDYAFGYIVLGDCILQSKNIKFVPVLRNSDKITIDLYAHEQKRHAFNLVYKSVVQTQDNRQYNFKDGNLR